ncbi:MAG: hypothetical protein RJA63_572 [Pseudomonadota bacterium]|jgi:hypothetical protein
MSPINQTELNFEEFKEGYNEGVLRLGLLFGAAAVEAERQPTDSLTKHLAADLIDLMDEDFDGRDDSFHAGFSTSIARVLADLAWRGFLARLGDRQGKEVH